MIRTLLKWLSPGVAVVGIIMKDSKILLTKRSFLIDKGKWCLPGGRIKSQEKAENALVREIKEETNLEAINIKFLFYHDEIIPRLNSHNIVLVFRIDVEGIPKKNYEVSEIRLFTKKEIDNLDLAFDHKTILTKFFGSKK